MLVGRGETQMPNGTGRSWNRTLLSLVLAGAIVPTLLPGQAWAQSTAQTTAQTLDSRFGNLTVLITAESYIAGIGFSVGAILKFKMHKDNPTQVPIGTPIGSLLHALSCPVFVDEGTLLGEDACVWSRVGVQRANMDQTGTDAGDWHFGGQAEIAPGWFLGGALGATGYSSLTPTGPSSQSRTIDAGVVLKRVDGPWLFAGGLAIASSTQQNLWPVALAGGGTANMTSSSSSFSGGLRLRGAYEFALEGWYLRPRTDIDLAFTSDSGLQEQGPATALALYGGSKFGVGFTPMLEVGGRYDVGPSTILRPYVAAGASFLPDNTITLSGNVGGTSFYGVVQGPSVIANVEAGLQFYEVKGWEMKMDYRLSAATAFLSQSLGVRVAKHF